MTSKEKIKALILYICSKIPAELSGVIKLNKIIWFSEIETMYQTWDYLTRHSFIRQKFGPVPLNIHIMREELVQENKLRKIDAGEMSNGAKWYQFETIGQIDIKKYFSDEQIKIIDSQINKYADMPALSVSDISHDDIWASLEDADEMPVNLYKFRPVYDDEQKTYLKNFVNNISKEQYGHVTA